MRRRPLRKAGRAVPLVAMATVLLWVAAASSACTTVARQRPRGKAPANAPEDSTGSAGPGPAAPSPGTIAPEGGSAPDALPPPVSRAGIQGIEPTRPAAPAGSPVQPGNESRSGTADRRAESVPVPTVTLSVSTDPIGIGDPVSVEVRIARGTGIRSAPFHLVYNAELLAYTGGEAGPFLGADPRGLLFKAAGPPGRLFVALTRFGGVGGTSGSGVLCTLRFRARAAGPAALAFQDAHLFRADRSEAAAEFLPSTLTIRTGS